MEMVLSNQLCAMTGEELYAVEAGGKKMAWALGIVGGVSGACAGAVAGASVGTITVPIVGTVSGLAVGAVGGAGTGFVTGFGAGAAY